MFSKKFSKIKFSLKYSFPQLFKSDLINHHNIEITKILEEPFKLWNKYTTNVLTSSSITRRFSGELFKKRKVCMYGTRNY